MLTQIQWAGLPTPESEYHFGMGIGRRWRFDMAWVGPKVALEVEGGTWSGGRHTTGTGFTSDCEKYSEAAILGWAVLRATGDMVNDGRALALVERALSKKYPSSIESIHTAQCAIWVGATCDCEEAK